MGMFDGKVALVTGGSTGMGRTTAVAFAREGAKVVIADVNQEGGAHTLDQIRADGGEALFIRTDITNATEVEAMVKATVSAYGRIDCAFNNAGISNAVIAPLAELPEDDFDQVIAVNLKGVWLSMKYEILQMLTQGGGVIVNTASALGVSGNRDMASYVASKHGVVGLNKAAALEYAKDGIRVNAICPGAIDTPILAKRTANDPEIEGLLAMTVPLGRIGKPEEIAQAVLWLCSDAASYITGQSLGIDGGMVVR